MIKLCVFDFDSTLMDGETIDILAKAYDKEKEVVDITHRAMAGEIEFFLNMLRRVSFFKGRAFFFVF